MDGDGDLRDGEQFLLSNSLLLLLEYVSFNQAPCAAVEARSSWSANRTVTAGTVDTVAPVIVRARSAEDGDSSAHRPRRRGAYDVERAWSVSIGHSKGHRTDWSLPSPMVGPIATITQCNTSTLVYDNLRCVPSFGSDESAWWFETAKPEKTRRTSC